MRYLALVLLAACTTEPVAVDGNDVRGELTAAYNSRDDELMDAFLEKWQQLTVRVTLEEKQLMSDTVRSIYEIFEKFWDPRDLNIYGDNAYPILGGSYYEDTPYAVVQGDLLYSVQEGPIQVTITNFRPNIDVEGKVELLLSPEYAAGLNGFLGPTTASSSASRGSFLNFHIGSIMPGSRHEQGWYLMTFPYVRHIVFTPGLVQARVHFRIGYEGGEALFERSAGVWEQLWTRMTWMELGG